MHILSVNIKVPLRIYVRKGLLAPSQITRDIVKKKSFMMLLTWFSFAQHSIRTGGEENLTLAFLRKKKQNT